MKLSFTMIRDYICLRGWSWPPSRPGDS